jgi:hypothetical protein
LLRDERASPPQMRTRRRPLETHSGSLSKHLAVGPASPELVYGMPLAGTRGLLEGMLSHAKRRAGGKRCWLRFSCRQKSSPHGCKPNLAKRPVEAPVWHLHQQANSTNVTNCASWRSLREAAWQAAPEAVVGSWSGEEGPDPNTNPVRHRAQPPRARGWYPSCAQSCAGVPWGVFDSSTQDSPANPGHRRVQGASQGRPLARPLTPSSALAVSRRRSRSGLSRPNSRMRECGRRG